MNRSEELAKLLGIEPEIEENYCIANYDDCPIHTQCCCPENCTKCDNYEKEHDLYPDFTKPNNFVKLLQLTINNRFNFDINGDSSNPNANGVYGYVCDKLICAESIEEYLIKMLIQLSRYEESIKEFKRQAQQTDWTY